MGNVAELFLDKPEMKQMKSRTCFLVEEMIKPWTAQLALQQLLLGYQSEVLES